MAVISHGVTGRVKRGTVCPKRGGRNRDTLLLCMPLKEAFRHQCKSRSGTSAKRAPFSCKLCPPSPMPCLLYSFFHLSPRYNIPRTSVDDSGARVTCKANISIETSIPSIFSFHTIPLPVPDASHIQRVFSREV